MNQTNITHYTKNQMDLKWSEKRLSTDANTIMTKTLEVSDKTFKAAIVRMLQLAYTNILKIQPLKICGIKMKQG